MKVNHLQIEIDGIDKEILRDLMEDARKPILQIANKKPCNLQPKLWVLILNNDWLF